MSKAQEVLVDYLIEMLKEVFITNEKSEMSFIHIEEKLKELTKTERISSGKKTKKTRQLKEYLHEERCLAMKKDGTRCNAKKHDKGENTKICSLHNIRGAKFGLFEDIVTETEEEAEETGYEPESN